MSEDRDDAAVNELVAAAKAWWEAHPERPAEEVPWRSWEWSTQDMDSPMKVAAWIMHLERDGAFWHMDEHPSDVVMVGSDEPVFTATQAAALNVEPEDSLLRDLACPSCGQRGFLSVRVSVMAALTRHGADTYGDQEWDGDSPMVCGHCHHRALAQDFRFPGLDDLIARKLSEQKL